MNLNKRVKSKVTLLNIISNIILQVATIVSGFILPKIILSNFGSEVNGLVSSLTQFLGYIALIEGGVSAVITTSLYKPLVNNNHKEINSIINTSNHFFRKIGFIFIIYSIILASIYPIFIKAKFGYSYIASLTIILSISMLIQYMFSLSYRTLLNADKKIYIVSFTQSLIIVLNIILSIISIKILPSIHFLKFISSILYIIQPLVFTRYVNKNYKIDKNVKMNNSLIKNRWNAFSINIAYFIHISTDITILTLFTNLSIVSIYGVYALVVNGLKNLINSLSNAISPTIGHTFAKNNNKQLIEKLNIYEYIMFIVVFTLFSIAAMLITPFVMIYTKNINDANYYQPIFGILLLVSEGLYLIKLPHLNLAYAANKYKEITIPCYVEAFINIIVSVILVKIIGLIGVAIGTIAGMMYRMIFHIFYTKKIIPDYKISSFYIKMLTFLISAVIFVFICKYISPVFELTVTSWLGHSIIYSIVAIITFGLLSILLYRNELKYILNYIRNR